MPILLKKQYLYLSYRAYDHKYTKQPLTAQKPTTQAPFICPHLSNNIVFLYATCH